MGDLESQLLKWSADLEPWQQDLLHRLAAGEILSAPDYRQYADEIESLQFSAELPWCTLPVALQISAFSPLDESHLQSTSTELPPVTVDKITHIEGANDLASGAEVEFPQSGLTIVAGKNGSGKSGYTRILKQVAASRGPELVLPNAFVSGVTPKAVVRYTQAGEVAIDLTWQADSSAITSPLQRVRVFDARSAIIHLTASNEIAYVPPTLQILAEYTTALTSIASLINGDLQNENFQIKSWPELETGIALEIFEGLGTVAGKAALSKHAGLSKDELSELAKIPAQIQELTTSDPAKLTIQARGRSEQLQVLSRNLTSISSGLSPQKLVDARESFMRVSAAEAAVKLASESLSKGEPLSGIGSEKWREMWDAARSFSAELSEHEFPDLSVGAVCVLCQQTIEDAAKTRFTKFADFMKAEAQVELDNANKAQRVAIQAFEALPFNNLTTQTIVDLVGTYSSEAGEDLLTTSAEALAIREWAVAFQPEDDTKPVTTDLSTRLTALIKEITTAAEKEDALATKYADVDSNALAANALKLRENELELRKKLGTLSSAIGVEHDRQIRLRQLSAAVKTCDTTLASRQNTKLSKEYVEKVCASFTSEAKRLGLDRVPVELVFDKSSKGVSFIKVGLVGAPNIAVSTILSEGEQRVTAIAGFFADLTEGGDTSTLVFDDPVSSLDQEYRENIARRLLLEAGKRQVLLFTHDFTFVQYLYEQKKYLDLEVKAGTSVSPVADLHYVHIARNGSGTGVPTQAEQWRHVSVAERIKRLNARIQNVRALYKNRDDVAYEKEARDIVGAIRDTWEFFVEQELLDGIVVRHERAVQTQRLKRLVDIVASDVAAVDAGMTIDSRYMTGHSSPASDANSMKDPDWLDEELKKLKDFRKSVLDRR